MDKTLWENRHIRGAKKLTALLLALCLLLAGCGGDSYTFDIQSGDRVEVALRSGSGHTLTAYEQGFTLEKDGVETSCDFVEADMIDDYFEWIPGAPGGECIEWGENDWGRYMFYSFDHGEGVEYGYVCTFGGTYIGIMITNEVSEDTVRDCVAELSISWEAAGA